MGCKIERKQKGRRNKQEGTGETIRPGEERESFGGRMERKMGEQIVMMMGLLV
jgi:hypothetical protein